MPTQRPVAVGPARICGIAKVAGAAKAMTAMYPKRHAIDGTTGNKAMPTMHTIAPI